MDPDEYALAWLDLGDRLRAHPNVCVMSFYVGDGVDEAALDDAERRLGFSLPDEVRGLYRAANAIQLRCILKNHPDWEAYRYDRNMGGFHPYDFEEVETFPSSCVNILGLDDLTRPDQCELPFRGWKAAPATILGVTYPAEVLFERLLLFDHYVGPNSGGLAAGLFVRPEGDVVVLRSSSNYAHFDQWRPMTFETYLMLVLHRMGNVEDRRDVVPEAPHDVVWSRPQADWSRFDVRSLDRP